jgi:hypothetical protein
VKDSAGCSLEVDDRTEFQACHLDHSFDPCVRDRAPQEGRHDRCRA